MAKIILRPGNVLTIVLGLVALGALTLGSLLLRLPMTASLMTEVSETDVEVELIRAGLDPESMTAAGVTSGQVAEIIADAEEYLTTNLDAMRRAEADHAVYEGQAERLRRLRRGGQASQQDLTDLAAAEANAAGELATLQSLRDGFFAAATDSLGDQDVVTRLETIAANRRWTAPVQYKCVGRSEAQWVALRDALANDRISGDLGEEPDQALQQLITACDAEQTTAAAAARLESNLAGVLAGFENAIDAVDE